MSPELATKYMWIAAGGFGVLVAAGILWWGLKKMMSSGGPALFSGRDRRRLGLVEWTSIGGGRQLLLVRRDNIEHLILTGGPLDVVVESGIGKTQPAEIKTQPAEAPYQGGPRPRSDLARYEHGNTGEPAGSDLSSSRSADSKRENGSRRLSDAADGVEGTLFMGLASSEPGESSPHKAPLELKE